jgi:hypothetical protein
MSHIVSYCTPESASGVGLKSTIPPSAYTAFHPPNRSARHNYPSTSSGDEKDLSREKALFFYVYAQLGPSIRAQLLNTLNIADITDTYDHRELLAHLKSLRTGLNKNQEPSNHSFELEMGANESFVDYFSKVQKLFSQGEATSWNDQEKMKQSKD